MVRVLSGDVKSSRGNTVSDSGIAVYGATTVCPLCCTPETNTNGSGKKKKEELSSSEEKREGDKKMLNECLKTQRGTWGTGQYVGEGPSRAVRPLLHEPQKPRSPAAGGGCGGGRRSEC